VTPSTMPTGRASIRFMAILGNSSGSITAAGSAPNVTSRDARPGERRPQTSRTAPLTNLRARASSTFMWALSQRLTRADTSRTVVMIAQNVGGQTQEAATYSGRRWLFDRNQCHTCAPRWCSP
jgi:hypothetical protein